MMMKEQMLAEKLQELLAKHEPDATVARHIKRAIAGLQTVVEAQQDKVRAEERRKLKQLHLKQQRELDESMKGMPEAPVLDDEKAEEA